MSNGPSARGTSDWPETSSDPEAGIAPAPVVESRNAKKTVERRNTSSLLENDMQATNDRVPVVGGWRRRVERWLFDEALPIWSSAGLDRRHGGFHEALGFDRVPRPRPKRTRTMARQIYAFAVAKQHGWGGAANEAIAHGIEFLVRHSRTKRGGWLRAVHPDGSVADPVEDAYDHAFVLLALAHAHEAGNADALRLGEATFAFLDDHLEDRRLTGFLETSDGADMRRSNPHMHLLETFLAWHAVTGERHHLRRAARIVDLFRNHFFHSESWTLGEYFDDDWRPAPGEQGIWTEPGHHFEWAALLVEFSAVTGQKDLLGFARKLYASAVANGLNRATGLAYGAVSREGVPLDRISRAWPQTEAIKAAIALDSATGLALKPEIETRVGRLFRWHIDPAPAGLWIDRIDDNGKTLSEDVPASTLYHIITCLTRYMREIDRNAPLHSSGG